jgi:hypothetical protein
LHDRSVLAVRLSRNSHAALSGGKGRVFLDRGVE